MGSTRPSTRCWLYALDAGVAETLRPADADEKLAWRKRYDWFGELVWRKRYIQLDDDAPTWRPRYDRWWVSVWCCGNASLSRIRLVLRKRYTKPEK